MGWKSLGVITLHIEFNNSKDHAAPDNKIPQYVFSISTLWKSVWWATKRSWKKDSNMKCRLQTVWLRKRKKLLKTAHKILCDSVDMVVCVQFSVIINSLDWPIDYFPRRASLSRGWTEILRWKLLITGSTTARWPSCITGRFFCWNKDDNVEAVQT